jgi:hypothetical protein
VVLEGEDADLDAAFGPLAGVVEEVAEDFLEVFALTAKGGVGWDVEDELEVVAGVEAGEGAGEGFEAWTHSGTGILAAGGGGAGLGELVVDLAAHAVDLKPQVDGELGVAGGFGAVGFLGEQGERGLEAVGEVAGFGQGALDGFLALREQGVEVGD